MVFSDMPHWPDTRSSDRNRPSSRRQKWFRRRKSMDVGVDKRRLRCAGCAAAATTAILLFAIQPGVARAEQAEITIAKEFGIGYLPYMIMEHQKLIEKHAKQRGLGDLKVNWKTFGGSGFQQSAIIAGQLEFTSSGVPWFLLLWDKMNGDVKSVGALDSMPLYLNTRDPNVKSLKDFGQKNKIAVPAIKSSVQAMTLQM